MSKRIRVCATIAVAIVAIVLLAVFGLSSESNPANGRKAPALPSETILGRRVTLASMAAGDRGRPFVVVFWASWCGPCAKEAPALARFARSAAGTGRIVGVDWSDARSGAVAFVRRYHWAFPVLRDAEGTVGNEYRLTNLPTTFVVNAAGRIRDTLLGPQTPASLQRALHGVET